MTAAAAAPGDPAGEPGDLLAPTLRLRLLDERDYDLYHALHASPEVMRAIGPVPDTVTIEANFGRVVRHNRSSRPGHRAWAIEREPAAGLGLITLLRQGVQAELGVMLLPGACHRGVGTQAIRRLLPHAFSAMGLVRVDASRPDDDHARVIDRLLLPLGFRRTVGLRAGEAGWSLPAAGRSVGRG